MLKIYRKSITEKGKTYLLLLLFEVIAGCMAYIGGKEIFLNLLETGDVFFYVAAAIIVLFILAFAVTLYRCITGFLLYKQSPSYKNMEKHGDPEKLFEQAEADLQAGNYLVHYYEKRGNTLLFLTEEYLIVLEAQNDIYVKTSEILWSYWGNAVKANATLYIWCENRSDAAKLVMPITEIERVMAFFRTQPIFVGFDKKLRNLRESSYKRFVSEMKKEMKKK